MYAYAWYRAAALAVAIGLGASPALAQGAAPGGAADETGSLEVVVEDDFDGERHETKYFMRSDRDQALYELRFDRQPPGHFQTGRKVKVRGRKSGQTIQVDALEPEGDASPTAPDAQALPTTERRAVVLMVDLIDAAVSSRYTVGQVASNMFGATRSVDGLYRDASRGQLAFPADTDGNGAPDVFGPFRIGLSASPCDYYAWAYAAESAAQAAGVNLSLYQHRVFVLPRYNDLSCTWAGVANVGCGAYCRAWIAEGESPMVFVHELGHNLGMAHAGTDPGNDGAIDKAYGDYSDPMGLSRAWHRFNGAHAGQMGWLAAFLDAVTTVVSAGSYDIAPIGADPAAGAPQVLKVEKPDSNDFYYLTYRQATGYDDSLSSTYTRGVNVHRYRGSGYYPTSFVTSLADGNTFADAANEITVTQISHDATRATVEIGFSGGSGGTACNGATPTVRLTPSTAAVHAGDIAGYAAQVTNNDAAGCPPATFGMVYAGSAPATLSTSSLSLSPGQTGTLSVFVNTSGLGDGSYGVGLQAVDGDGVAPQHATAGAAAAIVVDGTAPAAPTGLTASPIRKGDVRLSWLASSDPLSGIAAYTVYRDGAVVGQTTATSFTDGSTAQGTIYGYTVAATDGAGNTSETSTAAAVTTGSKGSGAKK